jgi:hypothetical protein
LSERGGGAGECVVAGGGPAGLAASVTRARDTVRAPRLRGQSAGEYPYAPNLNAATASGEDAAAALLGRGWRRSGPERA